MTPVLYEQLDRLLEVGRYRDARRLLQGAMAESPDDPELNVFAARIADQEGDPDEARRQLARALRADPTHYGARLLLYHVEHRAKNYATAEGLITELIRANPRDATLIAAYAELMMTTLHLAKSRALVDEALRIDPEDDTARLVDVLLSIVEGNKQRAHAQLEDLVADDPEGYAVATMLLVALIDAHRHQEALALAKQLLRTNPDDQDLVETVVELRVATHWLGLPLWPMTRFGWAGSAVLWVGAIIVLQAGRRGGGGWFYGAFALTYLGYAIYSWIYTPIMTRWVRSRGV